MSKNRDYADGLTYMMDIPLHAFKQAESITGTEVGIYFSLMTPKAYLRDNLTVEMEFDIGRVYVFIKDGDDDLTFIYYRSREAVYEIEGEVAATQEEQQEAADEYGGKRHWFLCALEDNLSISIVEEGVAEGAETTED